MTPVNNSTDPFLLRVSSSGLSPGHQRASLVLQVTLFPLFTSTLNVMAAAAVEEIRASSYVGFDSITAQIEHKLLKRGFQFNVIVVGACVGGLLSRLKERA